MTLGSMQDWPLRVMRLVDHAEREHGTREIVGALSDGTITRTNWANVARDARRMNSIRHLTSWYGVCGMGGVLHTINPRLFDEQLAYIGNHAEDRVLLYDKAFAPIVERLKPQWTTIEHFLCFEDDFDGWIGAESGDYAWYEGDERDPCGLCYTSGTTGNPKGVLYEHRSMMLHTLVEATPDCLDLSAQGVVLPIVPMFHANAWGVPWAAPMVGCKLVLSSDYRPQQMCELFHEEKVTHSAGVPTVWLGMIDHIERSGETLGDLKVVTIGGSAAPRAMIQWFRDRGVRVGHAWGMTEMSPIGTVGAPPANWDAMSDGEQMDYVCKQGRSVFGVELKTVDDEGKELPRDGKTSGRLLTRGPWVVKRYFKDDKDSVDADQWFDTGDVAALHPDGTLQITDRSKDVIKSGGEWISSIDLENAAVGCPGVAEAAAIGIPHPKWDERPLLVCVRSPGSAVGEAEILAHLTGNVAKWWLPDAIEFVDELPHSATGKLSKKDLRQQFKDYRFADAEAMVGRD
jgi:acyl-CoA synthetase (AMP-forming)/AMP-acid ligase II